MAFRLGFIGFGEVGYHYCLGYQSAGLAPEQMVAFYPRLASGGRTVERAQAAGIAIVDDPKQFAARADVILSVTIPAAAEEAAAAVMPHLGPQHLYADLNSSSARVKRSMAAQAAGRGIAFVDGVIVEAPMVLKNRANIVVSGEAAETLAGHLRPLGTPVQVLGTEPGLAATYKLITSIFIKGEALILLETLAAASAAGIAPAVLDYMKHMYTTWPFEQRVHRYTTGNVLHAHRRVGELDFLLETLHDLGIQPHLSQAARDTMGKLAELKAGEVKNWQQAVETVASVWRAEDSAANGRST